MVTFESMYKLGYKDALEDIREVIDIMLKEVPVSDEARSSFYAGMKVALHEVAEKTYSLEEEV